MDLNQRAWEIAHIGLRWVTTLAWDSRVQVIDEGGRAFLDGRPLLIAANHQAALDGPLICGALPRSLRPGTRFVTSHEIRERWQQPRLRQRVQRPMFDACYRPIWTGAGATSEIIASLRDGDRVVIMPEGDYWADHDLHPLRSGVAVAALTVGVPILPVRIDGSIGLGSTFRSHHRITLRWRRPLFASGATVPGLLGRLNEALRPPGGATGRRDEDVSTKMPF